MRVAIISPWYLANGGGTKVVSAIAQMFPEADLFALFARNSGIPDSLRGRTIHCSFLDRVPFIQKLYRPLLPLFPAAIESLDLDAYDLVISSDSSCAKGVVLGQHTRHICYCHTPMRYVWDAYRTFLAQTSFATRPVFAATARRMRAWDYLAAQRVDSFIANSVYIRNRIHTYYRRDAQVIYPPVETQRGYIAASHGDYYLSVGRLSRTKNLHLLIEACNRLDRRLLIAGTGREEQRLKAISGKTIEFLGRVSDEELRSLYAQCRALLFAADEDFGIVPVEAQSYGRPVIALGRGGSLETVKPGSTGVFFAEQAADSVMEAIRAFEQIEDRFDPAAIRRHACQFDTSVFTQALSAHINSADIPAGSKARS